MSIRSLTYLTFAFLISPLLNGSEVMLNVYGGDEFRKNNYNNIYIDTANNFYITSVGGHIKIYNYDDNEIRRIIKAENPGFTLDADKSYLFTNDLSLKYDLQQDIITINPFPYLPDKNIKGKADKFKSERMYYLNNNHELFLLNTSTENFQKIYSEVYDFYDYKSDSLLVLLNTGYVGILDKQNYNFHFRFHKHKDIELSELKYNGNRYIYFYVDGLPRAYDLYKDKLSNFGKKGILGLWDSGDKFKIYDNNRMYTYRFKDFRRIDSFDIILDYYEMLDENRFIYLKNGNLIYIDQVNGVQRILNTLQGEVSTISVKNGNEFKTLERFKNGSFSFKTYEGVYETIDKKHLNQYIQPKILDYIYFQFFIVGDSSIYKGHFKNSIPITIFDKQNSDVYDIEKSSFLGHKSIISINSNNEIMETIWQAQKPEFVFSKELSEEYFKLFKIDTLNYLLSNGGLALFNKEDKTINNIEIPEERFDLTDESFIDISPELEHYLVSDGNKIRLYNISEENYGKKLTDISANEFLDSRKLFNIPFYNVNDIKFNHDGKYILIAGDNSNAIAVSIKGHEIINLDSIFRSEFLVNFESENINYSYIGRSNNRTFLGNNLPAIIEVDISETVGVKNKIKSDNIKLTSENKNIKISSTLHPIDKVVIYNLKGELLVNKKLNGFQFELYINEKLLFVCIITRGNNYYFKILNE